MNVRWHLLFEQLQQRPELVEDELQAEVRQLAARKDVGDKEQHVLKVLRRRLGNFALQQLFADPMSSTDADSASSVEIRPQPKEESKMNPEALQRNVADPLITPDPGMPLKPGAVAEEPKQAESAAAQAPETVPAPQPEPAQAEKK